MAEYHVSASGSNTAPYDTWAKAATALATVLALATSGDFVYGEAALAATGLAAQTYSGLANVRIISTSDVTNNTPTIYTPGAAIQTGAAFAITVNSGEWYGWRLNAGASNSTAALLLGSIDGESPSFEDCTLRISNTNTGSRIIIGPATATASNVKVRTRNCSFQFSNVSQGITIRGDWDEQGSTFGVLGSVPNALVVAITNPSLINWSGSGLGAITGSLFPAGAAWYVATLANCDLSSSLGTVQQSPTGDGQGEVYGFDCSAGDVQYSLFHYNWRGSTVAKTTYYVTADGASYDGTNKHSLTITGVNGTYGNPYYSPWIDKYFGTAAVGVAITPYFEAAVDGSATKFNDDQVWAEFVAKTFSGYSENLIYTDRRGVLATAAAQATGTGTGNWTGLSGTAASMKLDAGQSITPQEIGDISGRVAIVGSRTLILDPKIRT